MSHNGKNNFIKNARPQKSYLMSSYVSMINMKNIV